MFQILTYQISEIFAKGKIFRKMRENLMNVKLALSFSYPICFGTWMPKTNTLDICIKSESSLGPGSAVGEKSQKMGSKEKSQSAKQAEWWPGEG